MPRGFANIALHSRRTVSLVLLLWMRMWLVKDEHNACSCPGTHSDENAEAAAGKVEPE